MTKCGHFQIFIVWEGFQKLVLIWALSRHLFFPPFLKDVLIRSHFLRSTFFFLIFLLLISFHWYFLWSTNWLRPFGLTHWALPFLLLYLFPIQLTLYLRYLLRELLPQWLIWLLLGRLHVTPFSIVLFQLFPIQYPIFPLLVRNFSLFEFKVIH